MMAVVYYLDYIDMIIADNISRNYLMHFSMKNHDII